MEAKDKIIFDHAIRTVDIMVEMLESSNLLSIFILKIRSKTYDIDQEI